MYVKFNGVISGDNSSGDYISEIKIVWKVYAESEAAAITAGRVVTLTAGTDDAKIAAFRLSGGGVILNCGTLTSGTTYTPAVMVTEMRTGGGTSSSGWVNGSTFTFTSLAAPAGTPTATVSTKTVAFSSVTNAVGYCIYFTTDGSTPTTASSNIIIGAITSWVFTTMAAGYKYKIAAIDTYGTHSVLSNVATAV